MGGTSVDPATIEPGLGSQTPVPRRPDQQPLLPSAEGHSNSKAPSVDVECTLDKNRADCLGQDLRVSPAQAADAVNMTSANTRPTSTQQAPLSPAGSPSMAGSTLSGSAIKGRTGSDPAPAGPQDPTNSLRSSSIVGRAVTNTQGEKLGDVEDLLMDASGRVQQIVLGVGGFLGLGEKHVAIDFDKLVIKPQTDGTMALAVTMAAQEIRDAAPWVGRARHGVNRLDGPSPALRFELTSPKASKAGDDEQSIETGERRSLRCNGHGSDRGA